MRGIGIKIGVASALLFLVLILGWWEDKTYQESEQQKEAEAQFVEFNLTSIDTIEITSPEGKLVIGRRNKAENTFQDQYAFLSKELMLVSDWMITHPFEALVDQNQLTRLLTDLEEAKIEKEIGDDLSKTADYSLDPAVVHISLKKADVSKYDVFLGDQNTSATHMYAYNSKDKKIVLIDLGLQFLQDKKVSDWREKRMLGIRDKESISKISVYENKRLAYELHRLEQAVWELAEPEKLPADMMTINTFFSAFSELKAKEVVSDQKTKLADYGLDQPQYEIKFVLQSGEEASQTKTLYVSKAFPKDNQKVYYAMRPELPYIFIMAETASAELNHDWDYFVSKAPFSPNALNMSEISAIRDQVEILRVKKDGDNGQWQNVLADQATPKPSEPDSDSSSAKAENERKEASDATAEAGAPKSSPSFKGAYRISSLRAEKYIGQKRPRSLGDIKLTLTVKYQKEDTSSENGESNREDVSESLIVYKTVVKRDGRSFYLAEADRNGLFYEINREDVDLIEDDIESFRLQLEGKELPEDADSETYTLNPSDLENFHEGHDHD